MAVNNLLSMSEQNLNSALCKQLRRLNHIIGMLKRGDVTAREVVLDLDTTSYAHGRDISCSARTLRRDFAVLREEYHCPIVYERSTRRYSLKDKNWSFPSLLPSAVDENEVLALVLGEKFANDILPPVFRHAVENAVNAFLSNNASDAFLSRERISSLKILTYSDRVQDQVFETVFTAWRTCHLLSIDYRDGQDKYKQHIIEPQALVFYNMCWGIKAYCPSISAWRTFLVSRIINAYEMQDTFRPNEKYIRQITADNYYQFEEVNNVKIRLTAAGKQFAQAHPLRSTQKIVKDSTENFILYVPSVSIKETLYWILAQDTGDAIPISPQEVIKEFKSKLRALLKQCL